MGVQRQELDWLVEQRGQYGAEAVLSDMVASGELDKPRMDRMLEKHPADRVFQAIVSQLERRAASEQAIRQEAEQEPVEPKLSVAERLLEAMPLLGRPRGVGEDPFLKMTRAVLEPVGRKVTRPLVGELQRKIRGAESTEEIRKMIDEPTPDSINRLRLLAFERLMPDIADLGEEYRAKILTMYPRMVQTMYPNLMKVKSREALRRDAIDFAEDLLAPEASEVRTGKRIGLTPKAWLAGAHPNLAFIPTITEKALDRFFIEPYFLRPEQAPTELVVDIAGGLFLRGAAKVGSKALKRVLAKHKWLAKDITAPLRKYLKREAVTLSRATWDDFLNQSVELRELPEQAGRALAGLTDDQIAEIGRQLEKFKGGGQVTVGMPRKILRTKGQPKTFGGWSLPEDLPVMDVTPLYEGPLEEIVAGQADRVIPIGKTAGMSLVDEVPEQIFRELTTLDRIRLKIDDVVQAGDHTGRIVDVSDPALVTVELPSGHTVKVGRKGISGLLDREPVQLTLGLEPEVPMPTASAQAATHKTLKDIAGEAAEAAKDVAARRLGQMPQAFQDFAGYSAVAKEAFAKLRTPHRDVISDVFGAVEKWRAELNKAALYTDWARDSLRKMKLEPDQMAVVTRWLDEPAHYKKAFEALPSDYKVLGKILKMDYTDMHQLAQENGILRAWLENYTPHMYSDRQSRVLRNLYPSGGRLGKKFKFARMRKYKTFREAEAAGLTPIFDPILLNATYKYQLHRTMANKHLVDTIQMLKREDGLPLIMGRPRRADKLRVWEEEYQWVNVHGFRKYMYVGQVDDLGMLVKLDAKADPDVAKVLNDIYGPWTPRATLERAVRLVQGKIRRIIMFNPVIHGANILSDVMDEVSFIPIPGYSEAKAIKTMRRGSKLYKAKDELVEYAVETGLQLPGASKIGQELRRELTDIGNVARIWQPIGKAERWVDDALWTGIVRNSQLGLFENLTFRIAKKHPEWTKEMVGQTASSYINTLLGTLPHTWMPRWARQWGSLFLFARNWTYSNIDMVVKAMTRGKAGLGMKALTRPQQREIANMFSLHLAKGLAGLTIYANTVQVGGLLVSNAMKEAGILDGPQLPVHSTFQNEKGHWFDADVGLRNKKQQAQYLVVPQFRYVRDYIGWGAVPIPGESNPARTLYNKMEPALKSMVESMANYSIWRQQKIVERGAPTYKHLVDRAKYFAMTVTPVGRFMARPGQKMTLQEYIAPFAGIWFRRGAPGGKYTAEMFDFLAKEGYKKSELQNEIERLWQEDKVEESMLKMVEKADTPRAMVPMFQNTAGRYAWPLNHYYDKMTDAQRLRFRERLRKRGLLPGLDEALAREAQAVWERDD